MYIANNNILNSVYILHEDKKIYIYIWPQVNSKSIAWEIKNSQIHNYSKNKKHKKRLIEIHLFELFLLVTRIN